MMTPSAWAAALVESLGFENNTLVITSQSPPGKPKMETWESKSGNTLTRMVVLDLPNATADKALLDRLVAGVRHANIRRLIATPMNDNTVRIVIEMAHKPQESIQPVVSQSGNETRLALAPVSTEKPKVQAAETPKPVASLAQKEINSLKAELEIASAQRAAFQKKNQLLAAEVEELKNLPAPRPVNDVSSKELETLKAELEIATTQRDAFSKKNAALADELEALKNRPAPKAEVRAVSSDELNALKAELAQAKSTQQELALANQAMVKKIQKLESNSANSGGHLQAALEENVRLQQALQARKNAKNKSADVSETQALEIAKLTSALNNTVAEREQAYKQNETLRNQIFDLRGKLVEQDDVIRHTVAGSPDVAENLRIALLRTVQKLKAAEEELARLKNGEEAPVSLKPEAPAEPEARGFFTPSREQLEYTIRNQPDDYDAYIKLHGIYIRQRDYERAEAVLQNLLMVNPRYPDAYYALSEVYLLQNNPMHARASLETYKRLRPDDANRITALEKRINASNAQF